MMSSVRTKGRDFELSSRHMGHSFVFYQHNIDDLSMVYDFCLKIAYIGLLGADFYYNDVYFEGYLAVQIYDL